MRATSLLLIATILSSCSHKQSNGPTEEIKTVARVRAIKKPQTDREKALERYRKMREKGIKGVWRPVAPVYRVNTKKQFSNEKTEKKPIIIKRLLPKKTPENIVASPEELKIEIDQNLSYYCMANRNNYSEESQCQQDTSDILKECRDKFEPDDRNLLNCVKGRLRL